MDRAILDAFAQQPADPLVDLGFHRLDVGAHVGREILVLDPHHAPAELRGDRLTVAAQHRLQPLPGRHRERARFAKRGADLLYAGYEALEEELLLVTDVVVDGRLGHGERRRNVIQRGVVISLAVEGARGRADHRIALDLAITQPLAAGPPGGGGGILARGRRPVSRRLGVGRRRLRRACFRTIARHFGNDSAMGAPASTANEYSGAAARRPALTAGPALYHTHQ